MTGSPEEDRYEALELIVKVRQDGESWFNIISDLITSDCQGGGGDCLVENGDESDCDDHEHSEEFPCTCGLESMGGSTGTLDEAYRHQGIANDIVGPINKADLELILDYVRATGNTQPFDVRKVAEKLRKECTWWDDAS